MGPESDSERALATEERNERGAEASGRASDSERALATEERNEPGAEA
ncbi:MAG: hypothetical protein QOH45_3111 [Pseudonocardiales bacterium]|nr:hypothetical protein [Pseudonocardiales bacterium]